MRTLLVQPAENGQPNALRFCRWKWAVNKLNVSFRRAMMAARGVGREPWCDHPTSHPYGWLIVARKRR